MGVYSLSRQASLFVFPDGSYGPDGFKKYIISHEKRIIDQYGVNKKLYNYSLNTELINAIKGANNTETLSKLRKFSSKYADAINIILEAQINDKSVFVYCEFVQGSGIILFSEILKLFGFRASSGTENDIMPRFGLISNLTSSQKDIRKIINRFNQPDNMNGKIINVIIGSKVISEGFSLKNIQVEIIMTPHWNYSETSQAIARGYRLNSHQDLINAGYNPIVEIYQQVSMPNIDTVNSIDLEMYEVSEVKDVNIKKIERIIKESAFDCALNYNRNHVTGFDGERECDYMSCNYKCDEISNITPILDISTYQLYYSDNVIKNIIEEVKNIFKSNFQVHLNIIERTLDKYSLFLIITSLRRIIDENIMIINKYGFVSYLREEKDIYFLVNNLSTFGNLSLEYYTEYITVNTDTNFTNIINKLYNDSIPILIGQVCNSFTLNDLREIMVKLPVEIKEYFIEYAILAKKRNINKNKDLQNILLEYFKNYYKEINGVWISSYMYDTNTNDILRCLKDDEWVNCSDEYIDIIEREKDIIKENIIKNNQYGFYGLYNNIKNIFCIRDIRDIDIQDKKDKDHRPIKTGLNCISWTNPELIKIMLHLKVNVPNDFMPELSTKKDLLNHIDNNINSKKASKYRYIKELLTPKMRKESKAEDIRMLLFWGLESKNSICSELKKWFIEHNLLLEDNTCGGYDKKKVEKPKESDKVENESDEDSDTIFNPETKRYVKKSGKIGQLLLANK
jgi:hypothetical protein